MSSELPQGNNNTLLESISSLPIPGVQTTPRSSSRAPSAPRREETQDSEKAGRIWAREVDDPWWPCILTLDGGGIRGYSSLLIMKALMHEVWEWEQYYDSLESGVQQIRTESPTELLDAQSPSEERGRSGFHSDETTPQGETTQQDNPTQADRATQQDTVMPTQPIPPSVASVVDQDNLTTDRSMKKALTEEELLPCHYFDFMYGTSTGGLIATILGRLRMTVTEGLELYRQVGNDLFGTRRSKIPLMTKYYHQPLEKAVRDIVASRSEASHGNDLHPWNASHLDEALAKQVPFDVDDPRVCHSCCLTATHDSNFTEAYLLRTYPHYYTDNTPGWITRYNEGADPLPIWVVTRATSAAPFYFEMVEANVNGEKKLFKDGGIRENNPSGAAFSEFHALYEGKAVNPALLLSIGTGRPDYTQDGFAQATTLPSPFNRFHFIAKFLENLAVFKNVLIKYTEGEHQHIAMKNTAQGEHTWYKRLNAEGLEGMPLDDWRKGAWKNPKTDQEETIAGGASLTQMEEATEDYLNRPYNDKVDSYAPPAVMLRQAAQKLVLQRRAREADGGIRWDTFIGKVTTENPSSGGTAS